MTSSQRWTDAKPLGKQLTKTELIALEHKWRIKLKDSGFQDVEQWSNDSIFKESKRPKKIKFIKGHIRLRGNGFHYFKDKGIEKEEYFRLLGLWAHHCPTVKYRETIIEYVMLGSMTKAMVITNPGCSPRHIDQYIYYNRKKIIEFVNKEFGDE